MVIVHNMYTNMNIVHFNLKLMLKLKEIQFTCVCVTVRVCTYIGSYTCVQNRYMYVCMCVVMICYVFFHAYYAVVYFTEISKQFKLAYILVYTDITQICFKILHFKI